MVGTPSTVRPMGCHWPSPGVGVDTNGHDGGRGGQVGRAGGHRVGGRRRRLGFGMAPAAGLPPLGGACHVYQVFSAQVTMPPPPWSRTHSVSRLPAVGPRAGLVAAWPSDAHTGVRRTTITTRTVVFGWRPTTVGRSRTLLLAQGPALAPGRLGQRVGVAGGARSAGSPGRGVDHREAGRHRRLRLVLVVDSGAWHGASGTSFLVVGGARARHGHRAASDRRRQSLRHVSPPPVGAGPGHATPAWAVGWPTTTRRWQRRA